MDAPAADALGPGASRPPAAMGAFCAYLAAASLNAVIGVFVIVRSVVSPPAAGASGPVLLAIVLGSFIYAAALIVLARRFLAATEWARTALFIVSLLSLLAVNGPGLFVVLMLALADVLAFLRPVSAWLRARSGLRPA